MEIKQIVQNFTTVCELANVNLKGEIRIEELPAGEIHEGAKLKLPKDEIAIYIFKNLTDSKPLKVGKVGPKSHARFTLQHYHENSSKSNLAKSLKAKFNIENDTSNWIKQNTTRINLYLKLENGIFILNLLEAFVQCVLKPEFEGFDSQSK